MNSLLEAYKYLKQCQWIDLTHSMNPKIPHFISDEPLKETIINTKEKDGFLVKEYCFYSAYGTHVDAPAHFSNEYLTYINDLDLKQLMVPINVLKLEQEVANNNDYLVSIEDILNFEDTYGLIEPHSFVAFSSNWSKRWNDHDMFYNIDEQGIAHTPGWSSEAIDFLIQERNICGIGHETLDTDASLEIIKHNDFKAQRQVLNQNRYQIELMNNLDLLPPKGAIMIASVPKIDNAPSFPIRVFAIVEQKVDY